MASVVALSLRKKFLVSLSDVKTHLSHRAFRRFENIGKHLGDESTFLTGPESISFLYKLNDALADCRILKEQNDVIKEFFSFIDEGQMNEALIPIENQLEGYSSPAIKQPDFLLDRFTTYDSCPYDILGFDKHVEHMIERLRKSVAGFKAVGIYGMGGSGKTVLAKKVLNSLTVADKFEPNIIWTCLSDLTREDEVDIKLVKHIFYDLGFDIDSMSGNGQEDDGWLMKQLELQLHKLGNHVIVLDDVWHCSEWLTTVFCPTLAKTTGGAVIVTSRTKEVARKIVGSKSLLIDLNPSDDTNNDLLRKMVRQSECVKNEDDDNKIIGECHGLPLAAKTLPSLNVPSENLE